MSPQERANPTRGEEMLEKRRRRQRQLYVAERVWFAALAFIAVVVVLAAGIVLVSAHPDSCGWCHSTTVESAADNLHAELRCESCHAGDSVVGILQSRIAVIDMTVATVVPARTPVVSEAPSGLCLECHSQGMPVTVTVGGLRMNHRAPIDAGWECRTCHPGAGHEVPSALGGYTMDMCLSCHSAAAVNLTTCEVCHVDEAGTRSATRDTLSPWRITHGPNWQSTHGMGDLSTCGSCHPGGYCVRCHGANVPHPAQYLKQHGQDVMSRLTVSPSACRATIPPGASTATAWRCRIRTPSFRATRIRYARRTMHTGIVRALPSAAVLRQLSRRTHASRSDPGAHRWTSSPAGSVR
jgi:predicted CXXCH cytochrome family protein